MDKYKTGGGNSQKKENAGAREGRKVAKFSESRIAKAAGAEPSCGLGEHAAVWEAGLELKMPKKLQATVGSSDAFQKVHAAVA